LNLLSFVNKYAASGFVPSLMKSKLSSSLFTCSKQECKYYNSKQVLSMNIWELFEEFLVLCYLMITYRDDGKQWTKDLLTHYKRISWNI
jgi:hypothetical protein